MVAFIFFFVGSFGVIGLDVGVSLWYHKGGRDTALEAEAQLYSDNITWKDTALEAEAQLYSDNITWK